MTDTVCLYFQVHQPFRIRPFGFFDHGKTYFDDELNRSHLLRAVENCYLPANRLIGRLAGRHGDRFRVGFSISGAALEQFAAHGPAAIESFAALGAAEAAEFLGETDSHSLASVFSAGEFSDQVAAHRQRTQELLGATPESFRNTELIYRDDLAPIIGRLGFRTVLVEGVDRLLEGRSCHHVYWSARKAVRLLLKNHRFSDDIAFRFADRNWSGWPLEPASFAARLRQAPGDCVNLFMDYETLGEHLLAETGIFAFFEEMVEAFLASDSTRISSPGDVADRFTPEEAYQVREYLSWADEARDLSAWLGNPMQQNAAKALFDLEEGIKASGNRQLLRDWRRLTASDHLYYMSTKGAADGVVHDYFSPHPTPHDTFASFMNILHDLKTRIAES